MEVQHLLLAFVLLAHSLTSMMWLAGGSWLGLSRKAATHWMAASLFHGVALVLIVAHSSLPHAGILLLACVLVVQGLICLRRGLQSFLKLPHTDTSHTITSVLSTLFVLGICLPMDWRITGVVFSCMVICGLCWCTASECFQPVKREFQRGTAWIQVALFGITGALFMTWALTELAPHKNWPWLMPNEQALQFAVVFISLLISIMFAFLLGYVVITRLVQRLEHLSHHDALTGLLNRRAIETLLAKETQRLQRFSEPFSVLMVDIDYFKRINDRLGHPAGDAALKAVADTLKLAAREVDRVGRFGGEEFCVLLPHTLQDGALLAAERLRQAVSDIKIPWEQEDITLTISTGVATADDSRESLASLLRRADETLYQAKADGRNRVVIAQPFKQLED